jgi:hypothetical protein
MLNIVGLRHLLSMFLVLDDGLEAFEINTAPEQYRIPSQDTAHQ